MNTLNYNHARSLSSLNIRNKIRTEQYISHTSGLAPNKLQTNIVILEEVYEYDFENFCKINSKACPLVAKTKIKDPFFYTLGKNIDVRTDIPLYNVYKRGKLYKTVPNIKSFWKDNLIAFAIGCSFTFEQSLLNHGLTIDHINKNKVVPMYRTNIKNRKSGIFESYMVVSMRIFSKEEVEKVKNISKDFSFAHGEPIHIGNPDDIGIFDLNRPDWGDPPRLKNLKEDYFFWACGVTPQNSILDAKIPFCITHTPGHMLITDVEEKSLQC